MFRKRLIIWYLLFSVIAFPIFATELVIKPTNPKLNPQWEKYLITTGDRESKVWVFFTDKGIFNEEDYEREKGVIRLSLDPHALKRRLRVRKLEDVIDFEDLPVYRKYVETILTFGAKELMTTKWLNGACFVIRNKDIIKIKDLHFVREIIPVKAMSILPETKVSLEDIRKDLYYAGEFDYGLSSTQISQIKISQLHNLGLTGSGVRLAIFDTGFDRWHESLKKVRVFREWDFIYGDSITSFQSDQDTSFRSPNIPIQTAHGTSMLSVIAGYHPGQIIGPAFGADFILCKTERNKYDGEPDSVSDEYRWVRALEWVDSLGADIVSSSLGYHSFVDSLPYGRCDMTGKRAVTSKAASTAARRGILVVNAIGNCRTFRTGRCVEDWLLAPADADSIVAVGGDSLDGSWWSKSSLGPTYDDSCRDDRIKPEVTALAWGTYMANNTFNDTTQRYDRYVFMSGTSGATALIAGLSALLLEAHPNWGPMKIREALIRTASQSGNPDYKLGYGIANGYEAYRYEPSSVRTFAQDGLFELFPNPFYPDTGRVRIPFHLAKGSEVRLRIYTSSGEIVKTINLGFRLPGRYETEDKVAYWDGKNESGKLVSSGIYICLISTGYGSDVKKFTVIR